MGREFQGCRPSLLTIRPSGAYRLGVSKFGNQVSRTGALPMTATAATAAMGAA